MKTYLNDKNSRLVIDSNNDTVHLWRNAETPERDDEIMVLFVEEIDMIVEALLKVKQAAADAQLRAEQQAKLIAWNKMAVKTYKPTRAS